MKEICANCVHGEALTEDDEILSREVALVTSRADITNKEKREEFSKIKGTERLAKIRGLENLSFKEGDRGMEYITCTSKDQLKVEGAAEGSVHKYYFSCPNFKGRK